MRTVPIARAVVSLLVTSAMAGCVTLSAPSVVALPNGYYLRRGKTSQVQMLNRSNHVVLTGPIAGYAVHHNYVTGCVAQPPPITGSYVNDSPLGKLPGARYFVLDTASGHLSAGLDWTQWSSSLKQLGAHMSADIFAPLLPQGPGDL